MAYIQEKNPSDKERWICIFPTYINSRKTVPEGRQIAKARGVENPTVSEIRDICTAAGFNVAVEAGKLYPRDVSKDPMYRGRVRVQLKNEDNTPVKEQFPNRRSLLLHISEMIPKLKTRQQKQGAGADSSGGGQGKGKKKKNKKR